MDLVNSLKEALKNRITEKFLPLNVRQKLLGQDEEKVNTFKENCHNFYDTSLNYLKKWSSQFQEFSCFKWMALKKFNNDNVKFDDVSECLKYLEKKKIEIDESKLFDQFCNLKVYVSKVEEFKDQSDEQCQDFFKKNSNADLNSELLKLCEFFYAIPCHNAHVERIFSLISSQWTNDRNRLLQETVKGLTIL